MHHIEDLRDDPELDRTVALRRLGGVDQEVLALSDAADKLANESAVPGASL